MKEQDDYVIDGAENNSATLTLDDDFIHHYRHDSAEARSVSAKQTERSQLEKDIEAFLKTGGHIEHVDINVIANPPRKPSISYGSGPL